MPSPSLQAATNVAAEVSLEGRNQTLVAVVFVIAVLSLVVAVVFRRQVLAASDGTDNMREIAKAVQEGAAAYLTRQFKTLALFVVLVLAVLFVLPGDARYGSGGASSSWSGPCSRLHRLSGNVARGQGQRSGGRGARADDRDSGMKIAFRTGGFVGMLTVGLGLFGASLVVLIYEGDAPSVLEGFGFGAALLAMFMRVGGGIFTKPPTSAPTWSARSSRASRRTTRATPPPSPTTWATTWVTAPVWLPTCSSPTR